MNEAAFPIVSQIIKPAQSKQLVDEYLAPLVSRRVDEARTIDPSYAALWQAIESLLFAGGKRFRPYMTLLVFQAYSEKSIDTVLPAAAAQELLHLGMLIHDDIIDRDDIRYGVKNVASTYRELYESFMTDEAERRHYAESAAILAGNLLLSEAYVQVTGTGAPAETVLEAQRIVGEAMFAVIGGELLDTEAAFKKIASAHPLVIAEQKTASYSFLMPFMIGATFAGVSTEQKTLLREFGTSLGIAYQMRDDVIGVFGDEKLTGKSADGDIREGKRTFLIDEFYRQASAEQRQTFDALFGAAHITSSDVETIRTLLKDSGALDSLETTIADYGQRLADLVSQFAVRDEYRQSFLDLITICLHREK